MTLSWNATPFKNRTLGAIRHLYASNALPWAIVGFGILLRFTQFQANWSLMQDEARLAVNIVERPLAQLVEPLDYHQAAPIGFLAVEKLTIQALGDNEYVLRLWPFLAGIASLFLFHAIANRFLDANAVPVALGLFAVSEPLIYYSAAVKQYSGDVAIGLLLLWATICIRSARPSIPRVLFLGVVGASAVWFSHPAAFILAGIGGSLTLCDVARKRWARLGRLSIAYALWGIGFASVYFTCFRNSAQAEPLQRFWSASFAPLPPRSFSDLKWFVHTFFEIFEHPAGLTLPGVGAVAFLIGSASLFARRREKLLLLASPAFLALLASGLNVYPFKGRLLLFMAPLLLLLVAEGTGKIIEKSRAHSAVIGVAFAGLLFFQPLLSASYHLIEPRTTLVRYPIREEIKPVLTYLAEHRRPEDVLYLHYSAWNAFEYYQQRYGYKEGDYVVSLVSKDDWSKYADDLDKLRGSRRVWVLFSHFQSSKTFAERTFFLYHLDSMGTRLDSFTSEGAEVYLYDLDVGNGQ
jgi:hypothetical protein